MNKALFLDRDGIINIDQGYVYKWSDIVWIEETFQMIEAAIKKDYKIIVLTNQSGIAKGKYTHNDVAILHEKMSEFLKNKDLPITDWFYCADDESEFRKPRPGMLLAAQKKYDIDLSKSFMVGDKATDVFEIENGPMTFLVKGAYDLSKATLGDRVKVFSTHQEILEELKKVL